MHIYQTVTDRILRQLEAGVIPWRKTWTSGLPKSLTTGRDYRGINVLILGATAFTSRYWVTYREALRLGGHVRKGERASPVVYWKWRTPEELARHREETGRDDLARCVPFASAVFNLDQVEGVARPADDVPIPEGRQLELAEAMLDVMPNKPRFAHHRNYPPAYIPSFDKVTLPHLSQFENVASYFAVMYHEVVHSTGHPKRLDRFSRTQGSRFESYAFEELVAEFGAAFLCAFTGINNPVMEGLQASYIAGWSEALRKDPRLVLRAASAAQRAADYIRGKIVTETAIEPTREELAHV